MNLNWELLNIIIPPVLTILGGTAVFLFFPGRRNRLIVSYSPQASFRLDEGGEKPVLILTHSLTLRSSGSRACTNIRLGHNFLPHFQINPSIPCGVKTLKDGKWEVHITSMSPGQQIMVFYLYFPPLNREKIHAYIKSDQGTAEEVEMLLSPKLSRWAQLWGYLLLFMGGSAMLYIVVRVMIHLLV